MNLNQMMNLSQREIERMSRRELAKVISGMRSVARKRIERLEKAETYSPAYTNIIASGGIPTVKGMDVVALRNEYKRYKHFLSLKTSTVKGAKQYEKVNRLNFEKITGKKWGEADIKPLWALLDELREDGTVTSQNYRNALGYMVKFVEKNPDASNEDILEYARGRLQEEYEQSTRGFYASDKF